MSRPESRRRRAPTAFRAVPAGLLALTLFAPAALHAQGAPTAPARGDSVFAGARGFILRSADGAHQVRIRGLIQSDVRAVGGDGASPAATTFIMRRVRPYVDATLFRVVEMRLIPDFGGGQAQIFDAYADLRLSPGLVIRSGKFKPPVGLERLQGAADLHFIERGFPTALVPQRDVGFQVHGELFSARLSYAVGAFNGVPDGALADADNGSQKDVAARIFAHPFRSGTGALQGLGFGIAASHGVQLGSAAAPALGTFRSPGQQAVFAWRNAGGAGTTFANGARTRIAPQGYLYAGPLGLLAEYTVSTHAVRIATTDADLTNTAWQVAANWVVTGEKASFRSVVPARNYGSGGRGAVELLARVHGIAIDDAAFPTFANPDAAVRGATAIGVGVTWHLMQGIRLAVNAEQTQYDGGAAAGANRPNERALLARMQVAF